MGAHLDAYPLVGIWKLESFFLRMRNTRTPHHIILPLDLTTLNSNNILNIIYIFFFQIQSSSLVKDHAMTRV